jgi:hypothetical protein
MLFDPHPFVDRLVIKDDSEVLPGAECDTGSSVTGHEKHILDKSATVGEVYQVLRERGYGLRLVTRFQVIPNAGRLGVNGNASD